METFSALLALCAGNSPVSGDFPAQKPVMQSFDVFFDLRLIERLSKHSRGWWWFETLSRPLWRIVINMESQSEFINPLIMDIHNWIVDIHNWIKDYTLCNWIMNTYNGITDIHNYVYLIKGCS